MSVTQAAVLVESLSQTLSLVRLVVTAVAQLAVLVISLRQALQLARLVIIARAQFAVFVIYLIQAIQLVLFRVSADCYLHFVLFRVHCVPHTSFGKPYPFLISLNILKNISKESDQNQN